MATRIIYKEGDKIGRCFFVSDEPSIRIKEELFRYAKFKCICGNIFIANLNGVKREKISCGCQKRNPRTHGFAHAGNKYVEYTAWLNIKARCSNQNKPQYEDYGGRGIKVCDRWKNSFENFYADMGKRPHPKLSVERVDNDGNYEPSNCIWGTKKEQSRNTRKNVILEFNKEKLLLVEWAEKIGINRFTLYNRVFTYKWSVEKALTKPLMKNQHG